MRQMKKRMAMSIGCLLVVCLSGCCMPTRPHEPMNVGRDFDIPPSLVWRMCQAQNMVRDRKLRESNAMGGQRIDANEMFGLFANGFTNAEEIAARPRGDMVFCDDMLTEKMRKELWPFDVEAFEAELESRMVRDGEGLFRMKPETGEDSPTGSDDCTAPNPTIRWVNDEIERWAIPRLDAKFARMDDAAFHKATGHDAIPEGWLVWMLADLGGVRECFAIMHSDGAWNSRCYMELLCDDEGLTVIASFDSFPNRREAAAMRMFGGSIYAVHNLAVLEWRHRNFPIGMDPDRIKRYLEEAKSHKVSTAEANLKILHDHIPEAKQSRHVVLHITSRLGTRQ